MRSPAARASEWVSTNLRSLYASIMADPPSLLQFSTFGSCPDRAESTDDCDVGHTPVEETALFQSFPRGCFTPSDFYPRGIVAGSSYELACQNPQAAFLGYKP